MINQYILMVFLLDM